MSGTTNGTFNFNDLSNSKGHSSTSSPVPDRQPTSPTNHDLMVFDEEHLDPIGSASHVDGRSNITLLADLYPDSQQNSPNAPLQFTNAACKTTDMRMMNPRRSLTSCLSDSELVKKKDRNNFHTRTSGTDQSLSLARNYLISDGNTTAQARIEQQSHEKDSSRLGSELMEGNSPMGALVRGSPLVGRKVFQCGTDSSIPPQLPPKQRNVKKYHLMNKDDQSSCDWSRGEMHSASSSYSEQDFRNDGSLQMGGTSGPQQNICLVDNQDSATVQEDATGVISHLNKLFINSTNRLDERPQSYNEGQVSFTLLTDENVHHRMTNVELEANEIHHDVPRSSTTVAKLRNKEDQGRSKKAKSMPPRPPPPKNPHRYSTVLNNPQSPSSPKSDLSTDNTESQIFFGDGLFDVAKQRNEEALAFSVTVAGLRNSFRYDDLCNTGYVVSPVIKCSESSVFQNHREEVLVHVYTEMAEEPIRLKCSPYNRIGEVISVTLSQVWLQSVDDTDGATSAYRLKVLGHSEYMCDDNLLIEYEYIQDCLKFGEDIKLLLLESDRTERVLARSKEDDINDVIPRDVFYFFERPFTTSVSRQGLTTLMDVFHGEVQCLLTEATSLDHPSYQPEKLIQTVKAICLTLASLETEEITNTIHQMKLLKRKSAELSSASENLSTSMQSLSHSSSTSPTVSPRSLHRGSKVCITFEEKCCSVNIDDLQELLSTLHRSVYRLVELYCFMFDTNFTPVRSEGPRLQGSIEVNNMTDKFKVRVISAHRLPPDWKATYDYFEVECGVYYGEKILTAMACTPIIRTSVGFFEILKWDQWMRFSLQVKNLPRESRLCLTLYGVMTASRAVQGSARTPLGWVNVQLFNFNGVLVTGRHILGLWPGGKANPIGACTSNLLDGKSVLIQVEFDQCLAEVVFPDVKGRNSFAAGDVEDGDCLPKECEDILLSDLFHELVPADRSLLWENREKCCTLLQSLPLILTSVPQWNLDTLPEVYTLLHNWCPLPPIDAMELLKVHFPDQKVRETAVRWMENFRDDELCDYLPQLVQSLKYECYHDSALARFLIRRALGSVRLMHFTFWLLKDNITDSQFGHRFQVILGGLLSACGAKQREQFFRQDKLISLLTQVAQTVKSTASAQRSAVLLEQLEDVVEQLRKYHSLRIPTSPSLEVTKLVPESCSYFSSFSVPLKLVFKNKDQFDSDIEVIYKCGDDIRQDMLGMQLIDIMNKIWLREGLDLQMITYKCMATGPDVGMIEVVRDADTLGQIHMEYGLTGSFKDNSISRWLQKHNPDEKDYRKAVDNFTRSCAGYCVATYILGIGDRHNDNIMIKRTGHLFHIDFSRILGNVQMFGNFSRDRAPFVLTADMKFVIMGGDSQCSRFQDFVDLCSHAFNIIRQHANLMLNLFSLMLNAGIPQLSEMKDLTYMHKALMPNAGDQEATASFTKLIESSVNTKFTKFNFFLHSMAHIRDAPQNRVPAPRESLSILSFVSKTYNFESEGLILSARVVDFQKRYNPDKFYQYVINVLRQDDREHPQFIFRRFAEFHEFYTKLCIAFPEEKIPHLPKKIYLSRSQVHSVARKRRKELDEYLQQVILMPEKVSRSELVYTFFHAQDRDKDLMKRFGPHLLPEEKNNLRCERQIGGKIKVSIVYQEMQLRVMIMHARDLKPRYPDVSANPYVKLYLLPDPSKSTKQKTTIAKKTLNPTYNEMLLYSMVEELLEQRVLLISVWDNDAVKENELMGGIKIDLSRGVPRQEITKWYDLTDIRKE